MSMSQSPSVSWIGEPFGVIAAPTGVKSHSSSSFNTPSLSVSSSHASMNPSSSKSESQVSMFPFPSQSGIPVENSQTSATPLLSQSSSHSSGFRLKLQSLLRPSSTSL